MKKFFAMMMAFVMVLAMFSIAYAEEIVHDGSLPASSEAEAKITIYGLTDGSGSDPDVRLPSEYHVIVNWDITDGVYKATKTDSEDEDGFHNFIWDCVKLDFHVNELGSSGDSDVREGNWEQKPVVRFEVVNASTPDLQITATPSLKGDDAWADFIASNPIATQNTAVGTQTILPVLRANLGTGQNSYENQAQAWGSAAHNEYEYQYEFNWNYDALNQRALDLYKSGTATEVLKNTFVVTIGTAGGSK